MGFFRERGRGEEIEREDIYVREKHCQLLFVCAQTEGWNLRPRHVP